MNQQDIIAIKYNGMLTPIAHPPPKCFRKHFSLPWGTPTGGTCGWSSWGPHLLLFFLFIFDPEADLPVQKKSHVIEYLLVKKKKERITMFHFSSIRNLSYLKYIFIVYLNKHTIIKEKGDQVIKSMLTVHNVSFYCSDVNLWDCKSFNYDLTNSHTIHFLWICFVAIHIPSPQFSNFIFEVSVCMTSLIIQKPTIK